MYDKVKKVLLLVLAALVALFGVLYWRSAAGPEGVAYRDVLYFPTQELEALVYTGKADGQTVSYAVGSDGSVTCRVGETVHGPYTIREDPSAVPDGYEGSQGIEIRLGDEVLFRGCYLPRSTLSLIQEDGEPLWGSSSYAFASDGTILGENGRVITQQEFHEPDLYTLVRVALEPELTHRGSMGLYLAVTLLALFNIIQICFPHLFFRQRAGCRYGTHYRQRTCRRHQLFGYCLHRRRHLCGRRGIKQDHTKDPRTLACTAKVRGLFVLLGDNKKPAHQGPEQDRKCLRS